MWLTTRITLAGIPSLRAAKSHADQLWALPKPKALKSSSQLPNLPSFGARLALFAGVRRQFFKTSAHTSETEASLAPRYLYQATTRTEHPREVSIQPDACPWLSRAHIDKPLRGNRKVGATKPCRFSSKSTWLTRDSREVGAKHSQAAERLFQAESAAMSPNL